MGYTAARDMLDVLGDKRNAVAWHLRVNCYPPVPMVMLEPSLTAIERYSVSDYTPVALPPSVLWRNKAEIPPGALVAALHLYAFCDVLNER